MGDHNSGGNGSVIWSTEVDRARKSDPPKSAPKGADGWTQGGFDEDGDVGDWFTISIQVPKGLTPAQYLTELRDTNRELGIKAHPTDSKRVYFNVRIEELQPEQIRTSWGRTNPNVIRPHSASVPSRAGRRAGDRLLS